MGNLVNVADLKKGMVVKAVISGVETGPWIKVGFVDLIGDGDPRFELVNYRGHTVKIVGPKVMFVVK
jgi:hypothetical protein